MIVLTIGSFDPVHVDHVVLFRFCASLGDLVVGVNSDEFYREYRGEAPMFNDAERMRQVRALGYDVRLNDGPGIDLIRQIGPDFLVVGNDWLGKDYLAQIGATPIDFDEIALVFVPRGSTISSTDVRERYRSAP